MSAKRLFASRGKLRTRLALVLLLGLAATASDTRLERIGRQLICTCGCTQGAMVCNHVGCPVVTQMRNEIAQRSQSTDSDALVLQSFAQEYGSQVLAIPTRQGFNLLAWIMPWIAAGCGLLLLLAVVRRWSRRSPLAADGPADGEDAAVSPAQLRIQRDIDAEIQREWR